MNRRFRCCRTQHTYVPRTRLTPRPVPLCDPQASERLPKGGAGRGLGGKRAAPIHVPFVCSLDLALWQPSPHVEFANPPPTFSPSQETRAASAWRVQRRPTSLRGVVEGGVGDGQTPPTEGGRDLGGARARRVRTARPPARITRARACAGCVHTTCAASPRSSRVRRFGWDVHDAFPVSALSAPPPIGRRRRGPGGSAWGLREPAR